MNVSSPATVRFPPARTLALEPMVPVAVLVRTTTTIEPATPADPAARPAEAATASSDSVDVAVTLMSPPACAAAETPSAAVTCLVTTWTSIATPMPALPVVPPRPPAALTSEVVSLALTVMLWPAVAGPAWLIWARSPTVACVSRAKTSTMTDPPTAALPLLAAPAIATEVTSTVCLRSGTSTLSGLIEATAVIARAPVASACASASSSASVVIVRTLTTTAAPTPTFVPRPPERPSDCRPSGVVAEIVSAPVEVSVASCWTCARLVSVTTATATEPATPTSDLPAAAAKAQVTKSFSWPAGVIALTVMPAPVRWAWSPTVAVFVVLATLTATAAPTLTLLPLVSSLIAVPVALPVASVSATARTESAPVVASTVRLGAIAAALVIVRTPTLIAAPTPAPLLPWPPWALVWPFAWLVEVLDFGSVMPEPEEFGLLETVFWASVSASLPPSGSGSFVPSFFWALLLPLAPALVMTALATSVSAPMATPAPVTERPRPPVVVSVTTAIPIAAPTATLSPPASASAVVVAVAVRVAWMTIAPVATRAAPAVLPRRAVVVSLEIVSAIDGLTAIEPAEPASV